MPASHVHVQLKLFCNINDYSCTDAMASNDFMMHVINRIIKMPTYIVYGIYNMVTLIVFVIAKVMFYKQPNVLVLLIRLKCIGCCKCSFQLLYNGD